MQSTAPTTVRAALAPAHLAPHSLAAAFTRVPDPRRAASVAYPVAAVLSLAVAAILANGLSELPIAQWGARQPAERLRAPDFLEGRTPCQSILQRLFCIASTALTTYLDWPGLAQVFRLERTWREHGAAKQAVLYGITSLTPHAGPPARLLALKRGHWAIENRLHRVKDVTLGEDQSTRHAGQGPTVMAFLRDAALSLLRRAGVYQIAARLREHAQDPDPAVALALLTHKPCAPLCVGLTAGRLWYKLCAYGLY